MARFILSYQGMGSKPALDVEKFRALPGTCIIDDSMSHVILIEGPEDVLRAASEMTKDWVISPETVYRSPGYHPLLEHYKD